MQYKEFQKTQTTCPFCGEGRQGQLFALEHAYLTYALAPYTKHHLLVIPNRHIESVRELTPEEALEIEALERKALDVLTALGYTNATLLMREGDSGDKSVAHLHYHVIPKVPISTVLSDGRERRIMTPEEITETIADIRGSL